MLVAVIVPRTTPFRSVTETSVPLATIVPKLFDCVRAIAAELVNVAVPLLTFATPDWLITPPADTVSPVADVAPKIKPFTSVIATLVPFAKTVPKSFDWFRVIA